MRGWVAAQGMAALGMAALGMAALGMAGTAAAGEVRRPVVVELFTSQGCSSCPPADAFLTELVRSRPDLLALAFHVTYWNRLGWADPFSFEAATERQRGYVGALRLETPYTPQMVVDGRFDLVGSDRGAALRAIAASGTPEPAMRLAAVRTGDSVAIDLGAASADAAAVLLIGYDDLHSTPVARGENGGRVLVEANIVRSMEVAGQWRGAALALTRAAPAGQHLAVIVQRADGRILAAARVEEARG